MRSGDEVVDSYIEDLELMKEKNIDMVVMHLTTHQDAPTFNELGLERIKKIIAKARALKIKIAFENTRKKGFLEYVLGEIKDEYAGVCFDAGHNHVYFDDTFDFELFKDRIMAVHLHDNDKSGDLHLLPFDATIDWDYVIKNLKKANYTGPITLELCNRNKYFDWPIDEFYKEGAIRGKKIEEKWNKK